MVLDYRAPRDSDAYRNAHDYMWGECFLDGVKQERVCYADTEAGVIHVYATVERIDGDGVTRRGPYVYKPSFWSPLRVLTDGDVGALRHPHSSDIPDGCAYYDLVEPTFGEPVRVRRYGRVEIRQKASA